MRKQFLWIMAPGLHYMAPGNVQVGSGDRGSVSFWYHRCHRVPTSDVLWRVEADSSSYAQIAWTPHTQGHLELSVVTGGQWQGVRISNAVATVASDRWSLITATWDLSQPGAGVLHLYANTVAEDSAVSDASGLILPPVKMYVGSKYGAAGHGVCFDELLVLDEPMTREQHLTRLGPGGSFAALRDARRRAHPRLDLPGRVLFRAPFDGSYDAAQAAGDATAYIEAPASEPGGLALMDDGSRYKGRRLLLPLGKPRQDFSPDDRLPLEAVLSHYVMHGIGSHSAIANEADCARLTVSQAPSSIYGEGRGWLWPWLAPGAMAGNYTLRMRLNMPPEGNPTGYWTALGPIAYHHGPRHGSLFANWGSGVECRVVADAANSASEFRTNLGETDADYWRGAELSVITGNCAPARLKVAGYDPQTRAISLAGSLSAVPEAGSICVVDFRARLAPHGQRGGEYVLDQRQSMEAWLWEAYAADLPWIELECQRGGVSVCRYARGRSQFMHFTDQPANDIARQGMMFGKLGGVGPHEGYRCDIRLESLEIDGPGSYQLMAAKNSRYGRACALADHFMVLDPTTGMSTRLWRTEDVTWRLRRPEKCATPALTASDLRAPGTWREHCELLDVVDPLSTDEQVSALVRGRDSAGVWRLGYLTGSYDPQSRRMSWADESPPEGRSNPFMEQSEILPTARSDSGWGVVTGPVGVAVFRLDDGTWSLVYHGSELNPDHYLAYAMHGAPDRWSFSHDEHFWPHNPIAPGAGGVDKLPPEYGGVGLWCNRDCELEFVHNPYALDPRERFLGYGRGKTVVPGEQIGTNVRPLVGAATPDLKAIHPLPHGNTISPLPAPEVHAMRSLVYGPDLIGLLVEFYGRDLRVFTSEDGVNFQQLAGDIIQCGQLPGEPTDLAPGGSFCIGKWRLYYYGGGDFLNLAAIERNRESCYGLAEGKLTGLLETAMLGRPADGWGELAVNANPRAGAVAVEVVDPQTELPVAGYAAADCDPIGDDLQATVTWDGKSLAELHHSRLRLVYHLSRPQAAAASPELYAWQIRPADAATARPTATALTVDGQANPVSLSNPEPTLGWSYSDPHGLPQSAYHVLVASTRELLDAHEGDLWDSGPVSSADQSADYAGAPLAEHTAYFWKLRVRNSEGTWSQQW